MKPEDIWRAIDTLADEQGVTPARLAKMSGLDQAIFGKARRMRPDGSLRWPSMESLSRILASLGLSLGEFVNYVHPAPDTRASFRMPSLNLNEADDVQHYDRDGYPAGTAWRYFSFPDVQDPSCFGIVVDTDEYTPVYRQGDMLVCTPDSSIRRGDRVIYKARELGMRLGTLQRQTSFTIDMARPDGQDTEIIHADQIDWMARIAWVRQ